MKETGSKRNIIIISLVLIFFTIMIVRLYGSFAISNVNTANYEKTNKVFKLSIDNIDNSTYTTTISKNDTKDLDIIIENNEEIDLNYALYYSNISNNNGIEIATLETSTNKSNGIIEKKSNYNIKIRIINSTNTDINITIGIIYGYKTGGDLILDDNKYMIKSTIKDDETIDTSGANKPNITNQMIPVYYDDYDHNWKKADETNKDTTTMWYNYMDKKWANIVLKDNTRIIDISNNLNNGTNKGTVWDKDNGTITTNNGYIDCGLDNYYFGNKISIIMKLKFNNLFNNQLLISNLSDYKGLEIKTDNSSLSGTIYLSDNDNITTVKSSDNITTNTWYTIVLTYDGNDIESDNLKLYLNGKLVGSTKTTGTITISDKNLTIGNNSNITVSDLVIYNTSLKENDIKDNFNENINTPNNQNMILYYNFMDGVDIPNGTVISDKYEDGTLAFFTWIPRYKYKVWNIEKISSQYSYTDDDGNIYEPYSKGIDIIWENGTNTTGTIECNYSINNSLESLFIDDYTNNLTLSEKCTGNNGEYYTHPAFNFNEKVTGFWIAKFETSGTIEEPLSLPDNISLENSNISDIFTSTTSITENNLYSIANQKLTSHVLKNTEWGAVSYLTHSIYGLCNSYSCQDVKLNNSSDNYTGRSLGLDLNSEELTTTKYGNYSYKGYMIEEKTGKNTDNIKESTIASTTGNVYGVYDLAGGRGEYVMAILSGINGTSPSPINTFETKYYDLYSYGNEYNTQTAYNRTILGDATGEIVLTESISNGLWYNQYNNFLNNNSNILTRGGNSKDLDNSGIFSFESTSIYIDNTYGYRIAIS